MSLPSLLNQRQETVSSTRSGMQHVCYTQLFHSLLNCVFNFPTEISNTASVSLTVLATVINMHKIIFCLFAFEAALHLTFVHFVANCLLFQCPMCISLSEGHEILLSASILKL